MDHQAFAQLLGNYGEFVGSIAVLGTLVYLAVQVRQSNVASQSTALQSFYDLISTVNVQPSRDPDFTMLLRKGYTTWDGCTQNEKAQLHMYWNDYMTKLQMGFQLFERGVLDERTYCAYENFLLAAMQTPAAGAIWAASGPSYPQDFASRIDAQLADSTTRPPPATQSFSYFASDRE